MKLDPTIKNLLHGTGHRNLDGLNLLHRVTVGLTAIRLQVHANTVRYRINRFREATGLDVRRTEDLMTAWWLLNGRRTVWQA